MANLVELFDNIVQMQNLNGVPLANGKMYVYALGRTRLMDTWSDVDGESLNSNPIILDAAGQCHCYCSDDFDYTIVVTDAYDNEIFSIDKYLYSKGSHSHADVAVAPSETIAVSSYHVGETTVYVPYLTGQLGKVYEGIDPIVVNNTEDKISANHVPLGVQEPLYFVQDDEEGCIIGISGGTVPAGTMNESAFGYEEGQITGYNGSAFSAGNSYEAGSYIDIDGNTLNVTGLTPVPADTASTGLVASVSADITAMIPDTSDMATQTWVNEQGFLTAHQDISNKLDTTAFSTVSGDFLTAIPSEYVTETTLQSGLSSKLDSTAFSTVSGDFLTAHQSLDDYATKQWVEDKGYLTAVDIPESATWNSTTETVSANSAQWGASNPQIPVTGINGIKISESADQVVFEVSANYATEDWVTGQGYLTAETDWTNTITAASANAYNEATAAIPTGLATTGDLASVSADITAQIPTDLFTKASADTLYYPLESNPAGYLTAHQDLSDYQTTAGMTAYMTTADSAEFMTTAERADYIPTGVSSEFYTTANTAGYISEVPDTYLQNTDLATADGKVTAISGIPLSAGGDVPEGVMVESGLEYNAVNEISGYNGSAIAQYGAEKQWLQHDDTLVHAANSAQYALGVNLSAVAQLLGVDETVLYSGNIGDIGGQIVFSEPFSAFNKIKVRAGVDNPYTTEYDTTLLKYNTRMSLKIGWSFNYNQEMFLKFIPYDLSTNSFTYTANTLIQTTHNGTNINVSVNDSTYLKPSAEFVVIGIGRKEV